MTSTIGKSLVLVFRDPVLRLVAFMFMLLSSALAGIIPYQALIGVDQLGLSEQIYGIVIAVGGVHSVVTAVIQA